MEKEERDRITRHLHELVTYTICDAELLTLCHERGVFSISDVDKIASIKEHLGKAYEFYRLIQTKSDSYHILKDSLLMTNQNGIVEILERGIIPSSLEGAARVRKILYDDEMDRKRVRLSSPSTSIPGPILEVTEPVPLFTGRSKELEELHKKVLRSAETGYPTVISQLTSITGLGGIGKSQLSRKYVQEQGHHFDNNCVWLNAETENSLGESFSTLAKDRLGIPTMDANNGSGSQKKIQTVVGDVYRFFRGRKSLFIFDNAERAPWLKQFLPKTSASLPGHQPHILITSRTRDWDKGIEVIDLNELDLDDAMTLVKKGLGLDLEHDNSQKDGITRLVKRLQCFPLALQQAVSYIEDQQQMRDYSVATYLEEFDKRQKELLAYNNMDIEVLNDYTMTTLTTWKMTVEKLGKDDTGLGGVALKILYAMAYLSPEGMKRDMFLHLKEQSPTNTTNEALMEGTRLLLRHSMARGKERQSLLSVHRLVQDVTRLDLVGNNLEASTLESVLHMLSGTDGIMSPPEYLEHLLSAWKHVWKHPALLETFSYLPAEMVWFLYLKGRDDEALNFARKALEALGTRPLAVDDPSIVRIHHCMSPSLIRRGELDEALELMRSVVEKRKAAYGLRNRMTLDSMNNLGLIYNRQGRFEEALELFQTSHETMKAHLPDSPNFNSSFHNLGIALFRLGREAEALTFLSEAYQRLKQEAANKAPVIILAAAEMSECMASLGDYTGALELLEEHLSLMETLSPEEQVNICDLLRSFGRVLRKQGDNEGALLKHKQAYQSSVNVFGLEHLETVMSTTEIAEDLLGMGKCEDAQVLLEEALQKLGALLGEKHFEIVRIKVILADAIKGQGTKELHKAVEILAEEKAKVEENGWGELAFFRNGVCKEIDRIQKDISQLEIK